MKKSANEVWKMAQEKNLNKQETKALLVKEGIIISKRDRQNRNRFFKSLARFLTSDIVFYNEQLHQLSEFELDEFNTWSSKHLKTKPNTK